MEETVASEHKTTVFAVVYECFCPNCGLRMNGIKLYRTQYAHEASQMISRSLTSCTGCSPESPLTADVKTFVSVATEDDLKNYPVEVGLG